MVFAGFSGIGCIRSVGGRLDLSFFSDILRNAPLGGSDCAALFDGVA
jgi:hypothetical protein